MAKREDGNDGTYQIVSSGLDDKEMNHPKHGAMFSKHGKYKNNENENVEGDRCEGLCFMATFSWSRITDKAHTLLIYSINTYDSYNYVLSYIDDNYAYLNYLLIYLSSDTGKTRNELYEVKNKAEEKNSGIDSLSTKLLNISMDKDVVRMDNIMYVKQRNIYFNTTKWLYVFLNALYHSSDIF